ncbi:MAG: pyridoxamine 5'-phosphate oxidase family protein [Oscillospiraceae bacterium]|nr:pyridoxamine 5'-phosphate oxidase family protein [Oscillospiraceae bacterium]
MDLFTENYQAFLAAFGQGRTMVLSTAADGLVSSRMMSVVRIGGTFFFQTDTALRKYRQLAANPNAALCIDNIQIEGVCKELGHPLKHPDFCAVFKACFKGSFDAYTALEQERLFSLDPRRIERWIYKDGVPHIETFDLEAKQYSFRKYFD